jgi:SAM-dependent methyltransferase
VTTEAGAPAAWLTEHAELLPRRGTALDVACGRGRHALWLAARGLAVTGIDRDETSLRALVAEAARRGVPVNACRGDLEKDTPPLAAGAFDVIVVVHYLHRPLFPYLRAALRVGGTLVYETFTRAQARRGKPTNPAFLLDPRELPALVAPLEVLARREGAFDGREVASVIARRIG